MSRFEFNTVLVSSVLALRSTRRRLVHAGVLTPCWAVHATMIAGLQR